MRRRLPARPTSTRVAAAAALAAAALVPGAVHAGHTDEQGVFDRHIHLATRVLAADLVVEALEVTQGVQDLQNDVKLVEGKRTFVRFYARASEGFHYPTARLFVRVPGRPVDTMLRPLNPGEEALVWATPRFLGPAAARAWEGTGFLFELPSHFTRGTIELTAVVNSDNDSPVETELANNTLTERVSFEAVPNPELTIYVLGYRIGGMSFATPASEADQLVDWLRRAYPVSDVEYSLVGGTWARDATTATDPETGALNLTSPNCREVNRAIAVIEGLELGTRRGPTSARAFSPARSIGMVNDGGGFMRGCATGDTSVGLPGPIASGPTGSSTWGWDTDGSYGDWYGGHELGHTYLRPHAEFCGAEDGHRYPYPLGLISPPNPVRERIYGFDISTRDIYSHDRWRDNMTYCDRQWMSDLTYEALMRFLQDPASRGMATRPFGATSGDGAGEGDPIPGPATKVLSVVGAVDPDGSDALLEPAFLVGSPGPPLQPEPGEYAIVLRDSVGNELGRHSFAPVGEESGPPAPGSSGAGEIRGLFVSEFVPFAEGTRRVDLEGPGGELLASLQPGVSAPELEIVSPKGHETFDGKSVHVSWEASDPDGDELTFVVQYRPDDATAWRSVALPTTETSVEIPFENLASGDAGRFRVWASDGVNTTIAETAAPFRVVNHAPEVDITSPNDGDVFVEGGSVALEAAGYDSDVGGLRGGNLRWSSSLDGELGTGRQLTVASLSEGTHVIQVVADDGSSGQDGTASAEVQIEVVGDVNALPKLPDKLVAGPQEILLTPEHGLRNALLMVGERNGGSVRWVAQADQPWLKLSSTSGMTPAAVEVSLHGSASKVSKREATIVIASPDLNSPPVEIQFELRGAKGGGK